MGTIIVACSDLMTGSRFSAENHDVVTCRSVEKTLEAVSQCPSDDLEYLLVDLTGFAELPGKIRESSDFIDLKIVAFAPHVREDLLDAARELCDVVLPRGAAVKRFPNLI